MIDTETIELARLLAVGVSPAAAAVVAAGLATSPHLDPRGVGCSPEQRRSVWYQRLREARLDREYRARQRRKVA